MSRGSWSVRGLSTIRGGSAARLAIVAILIGLEAGNPGHEAGLQSRRSTIVKRLGKVAAGICVGECATSTGCVMGG
jgi:hypothetical protein